MSDFDVFAALGDPTRRAVLEQLSETGPATATELSARLPVTRQAISRHLVLMADAGLVEGERVGREVRFRLSEEGLGAVTEWVERVGKEWRERTERLR